VLFQLRRALSGAWRRHRGAGGQGACPHRGDEFPSYQAALACYRSDDYQAAKKLREGKGQTDLVIVEGYEGAKF
jgi:hypothetical protein